MILSDGKVVTNEVILAFENLKTPDDKGKYTVKVLLKKTDTQVIQEITQLLQNKATEKQVFFSNPFTPGAQWHDGDVYRNKSGVQVEAYKGHWVLNAKSGYPVGVINLNGQSMDLNFEHDKLYSGVGIKICVDAYDYENSGNKGVSLGLQGVQVVNFDKTQRPQIAEASGGGLNAQALANAFSVAQAPQQTAAAPNPNPAPAPDFLQPPAPAVKTLIQTGAHTIEALRAAGWGDDQMVAAGHAKWSA